MRCGVGNGRVWRGENVSVGWMGLGGKERGGERGEKDGLGGGFSEEMGFLHSFVTKKEQMRLTN